MIKHDTIKLHTIEGRASYHDLREDLVRIALDHYHPTYNLFIFL